MCIEWDIEELACAALGKTEEETDIIIDECELDDLLEERYGVDFDIYCEIVKDLLPLTPVVKSAVMGKNYHAFCRGSEMIVKVEAVEDAN